MATQLGDLLLSLKLDSSSFNDSLNNAKTAAMNAGRDIEATLGKTKVAVNVQVKTEALTKLNEQLGATGKQIDALQAQLDKNPLRVKLRVDGLESAKSEVKAFVREVSKDLEGASKTKLDLKPTVDFNQIHELNKLIDVKVAHVASANPKLRLKPTIDFSDITAFTDRLQTLQSANGKKIAIRFAVDDSGLAKQIESAVSSGVTNGLKNAEIGELKQRQAATREDQQGKEKITVKTESSLFGGLKTGLLEGTTQAFGLRFGNGLVGGFERALNTNLKKAGEDVGQRYAQMGANAANNFAKSFGLQDGLQPAVEEFNQVLFKFENLAESSAGKIGDTIREGLLGNFQEAKNELINLGKDIAAVSVDAAFAPVRVRKREVAKNAVKEVIERQPDIKVDKNQAIQDAQSITIATGGLNFSPGGKENTDFISDLLKPILPDSYIVGMNNPATNDPSGVPEKFNEYIGKIGAKLGFDTEGLDVRNVGKLLEMAIIKGINPDAITMAATAAAYKAAYPDKPIQLVGTSGGGHVANDAIALLEKLGIDAKGIGITTPFAGLADIANPELFRAQIGTADPLYQRMFGMGVFRPGESQDVFEGVGLGHLLPKFVAEPAVQESIKNFLGDNIGDISPDVSGKKGYLNMLGFYTKKASDAGNIKGAISNVQGGNEQSWFYNDENPLGRLEDLKGYIGALREVSKKAKGGVQKEAEEYLQFLEEFSQELELYFASGKQAIPSLDKAKQYFPDAIITEQTETPIYTDKSKQQALNDFRYRGKALAETGNFRRTIDALRGNEVDGYSFKGEPDSMRGLGDHLKNLAAQTSDTQKEIVDQHSAFVDNLQALLDRYQEMGIEPTAWELDDLEATLSELEAELKKPMPQALEVDKVATAKLQAMKAAQIVANKTREKGGEIARSGAEKAGELARAGVNKVGQVAEAGFVSAVNDKMAGSALFRDPRFGGQIQIARAGDLNPLDYLKIAASDTATVIGKLGGAVQPLLGAVGGVVNALQALEDATVGNFPLFSAAKTMMQSSGAIAIASQVPVLEPVMSALSPLAHAGTEGAMTLAGGALMESVHQAPMAVQIALKPATIAVEFGVDKLVQPLLEIALEGQALLAPVKATGAIVFKSGDSAKIAQAEQNIKALKAAVEKAGMLQGARPEQSQYIIDQASTQVRQIAGTVDAEMSKMQPLDRMKPDAAALRNLKAEVNRVEEKVNAIGSFLQGIRQGMGRNDDGVIDAEYTEVKEFKALPGKGFDVQSLEKQAIQKVNALKETIKKQTSLATAGDSRSAGIAAELQYGIAAARSEIDAVMAMLGKDASKDLKQAVKNLRSQATRSEKAISNVDTSSVGKDVAAGMNVGLTTGLAELQQSGTQLAQAVIQGAENKLEIKSPSRVFMRIGQFVVQGLEKGLDGIENINMSGKLKPLTDEAGDTISGLMPSFGKLGELGARAFAMLPGPIKLAAVALFSLGPVQNILQGLATGAHQAALEFNNLERSLNFTAGGDGAGALSTLSDRAFALGGNFRLAAESYQQLTAATKDTALEGALTENIQKYVENAAVSFGLTAEKQQRMTAALVQIAAKGVVSQEEVRGQLAEAAPAAIGQVTRGLGLNSTSELNKRISAGMSSGQFLEALTRQGNAELGLVTDSASRSPQASFNRLGQAQTKALAGIGQSVLPVQGFGAEVAAQGLNLLAEKAQVVTTALGALGVYASTLVYAALAKMTKMAIEAAGGAQNLGKMWLRSLGEAASAAAKLALQAGALMLAVDLGKAAFNAFQDGGGVFREYATSIEMGNKRIAESFDLVRNAKKTGGIVGAGSDVDNLKGSMFADTAIGSIVGKENTEALEKAAVKADWMDWLPVIGSARLAAKDKNRREGSGFRLTSQAEKLANDRVLAINDAMSAANESLSTGYTMLGADGKGTGEMRQVIELDKRIKEIQSQRRGISATNPYNKAALDALKEQEKMLQSQREKVAAPVEAQSAQLSKIVEGHKKALSDLDKSFEGGGLTQQQYAAKTAEVKAQLAAAQKQQELFNKAMGGGVTAFDRFADAWSRITDRIADANTALRDNAALLKTEVAKGELSGSYTQGQAESMRNAADQQASASQLANLKTQIAQKQAELDSIDSDKVLKTYSVEPTDGASRLKTLSEKATDPREKAVLEKSAELRELQSQAKESEAALYESFANTNRQLKEATRSVDEFARGISRQSQELALAAKENRAEVGLVNARMKLKQAMQGFHQTFIDQFMGQVIEILQTSTEQTKIMIDAQRQVMGIQNTLQDQLLQAQQQANTLPGMGAMGAMNQPGGFVGATDKGRQVADLALSQAGKEFAPGLIEQCANFVRFVLGKAQADVGTTKNALDGYEKAPNAALAASFFGADIGTVIKDRKQILPGDLLAFGGTYGGYSRDTITHVGIATGNNMMVDRSTNSKPVTHRSMDTFEGPNSGFLYAVRPYAYGTPANPAGAVSNNALNPSTMPGKGFSLQQLMGMMEGGSNSQIAKIVGMAEGNRTADGAYTKHAYGHRDPGNGKWNIGSFSAQGDLNDGTIAGSDQRVIDRLLRPNIQKLYSASQAQGVAVTPKLLLNYIDLLNQAPDAATGWHNGAGMLGRLGSVRGRENDDAAINALRAEGFRNNQGRLETTFPSLERLKADQARRMGELNSAISAFGLSGGGKGAVMAPTTGTTQGSVQNFENLANTGNALQAKLAESSAQARQNAEQQAAQVLELANARAKELGVDNDGKVKAAISTLRTGNKESNATVRQTERDIEDRLDAIGYQTPEKQFNRERRQIERRQSDTGRSVTEELDRTKEAYEKAVKGRSAILESGLPKEIQAPLLVELDKSITTLKTNQDKLSKSLSESDRVAKLELDDAQRKRVETERLNALQAKVTLAEKAQANAQEEAANLRIAGKPDQAAELERSTTIGLLTERFNLEAFNLKKQLNEGMLKPEDYEKSFTNLQEGLRLGINTANRTKERAVDERLLARDQNLGGLRQEQAQNQIVQFRRDGDPFKALALDEQTQRNMQSISLRQQLAEQKQLKDQGKLTADEFDRAVGLLTQINDMKLTGIKQQFEDARRAAEFAQDKERFQSRVNLTNARSQSFKNYGLDSLAADYDKETAMAGANMDYKTERNRIDNAEKGGEITAETANKLRYELNELNKVTLDNISSQFNPLTQAIVGAKDAFGTMFSDLLEGTKSVNDIFKDLIGNLGRMLAQMAGKRLSEELFGMILGKGKKKSESESKEAYQGLGLGGQAGDFQGQLFASGEQFGRIVISSGEQFKAILTGSQYTPMSTTGSIPFAPLSMNPLAGGLSNEAFSNLGNYNVFSGTYNETPGSLLDTVEGDSILGGGLVSASNTAVENLKNGVGEASITFAASGTQAAQGLQVGVQGLVGAFDKFSKGDVGGGILGIAGAALSFIGGGLFGGKPKALAKGNLDLLDGTMPKVFASGNLGALDGIMSAMQQERAMSGYNPMLAVVNDKEAILSAEQTKRFYALGLDKQVRGFAAGNLGSGSRAGDSINVNIPVSVSGGDNRVNWDQAQSELGPQIQTMFATWVNQQRRDGGMFSG